MWAWPVATTRWALAFAGLARTPARAARAAAAVPGTSRGSSASIAALSATTISARRGRCCGISSTRPASTSTSWLSSQTSVLRLARANVRSTYSGPSGTVSFELNGVGCHEPPTATSGLAAASR